MTVSAETSTHLRNNSLSNKMLPVKMNAVFQEEMRKLQSNSLVKNQNICAYPIYEVWGRSENTEDSSNLTEQVWDYNDMIYPSRGFGLKEANSSYKLQKGDFDYKHINNDSTDSQMIFHTDICTYDISEKSVKDKNTFQNFSRDKQRRAPFKDYYRLCYDYEDSSDDSYDYPGEIFEKQVNSTRMSEPVPKASKSEDNSQPFNECNFDESEFVSVDLKYCNYSKEHSENEYSAISVEKDVLKGEHFEDYWQII